MSGVEVGALVLDSKRDRVGVVQAVLNGRVYLRPQGGGIEWDSLPGDLVAADRMDELRARVCELNANSGFGRSG